MKVTDDMREDRDWLIQTHNRTVGASQADTQVAWNDLAEAGWTDVFGRISGTWRQFDDNRRPTNRMPFRDQRALLQTCGVFKASMVLAALDLWIASPDGARQPSPADLFQLIAQPQGRDGATNQAPRVLPWDRPEVLALVADLIGRGVEDACDCLEAGRQHSTTSIVDERSILFCPECGGIEAGQAISADNHVRPFVPKDGEREEDLSAVVKFKRVRDARSVRTLEERRNIA